MRSWTELCILDSLRGPNSFAHPSETHSAHKEVQKKQPHFAVALDSVLQAQSRVVPCEQAPPICTRCVSVGPVARRNGGVQPPPVLLQGHGCERAKEPAWLHRHRNRHRRLPVRPAGEPAACRTSTHAWPAARPPVTGDSHQFPRPDGYSPTPLPAPPASPLPPPSSSPRARYATSAPSSSVRPSARSRRGRRSTTLTQSLSRGWTSGRHVLPLL